ncbi:vesicle transport v-SNARE protein VTI1, putative [Plasmodium vivax]|uniref:Uncharacterized protein n=6 Tax=Plasmodium vivax TaxID=5855 RepID=A5K8M3_PLAVS|nr:hypothetical protein, conserved [Plasmodium vivax]KMZ77454.1 hypothetical protein PVIIG_01424 [Plasmodium vivax India VII]KMZ84616.1 hypothetical protein PVBG_00396 [Plasmodium vivax Brazil I]KMZ89895.1 hypothetical protein PVMG_03456 [Plasmodium vivax Mauritania I]KMZ96747.1 hypothetical protein PVNG_02766 [Plasmodium vivax North Korean]EDL44169.1 hypothetical protein, conserved [Plasmodium vivax]|eukprot:XP_001613896.1 hypothetical protein [Plasmodium vivax Sal-1]
MADALYNDYKNNCQEYIKTVSYTEKILQDNSSDKHKLLNIYEKAIKSAENMFKRMQLEVEANSLIGNKDADLNDLHREITEYKGKLNLLKQSFLAKEREKNEMSNSYDDRVLLLSDVDLLEQGDIYINQSKILLTNSEHISNDVLQNLSRQRDCIKKGLYNMPFITNKLDQAKYLMHLLKKKQLLNKYRLYIIFILIFLTFVFVSGVKYRRYVKGLNRELTQPAGSPLHNFMGNAKEVKGDQTPASPQTVGAAQPDNNQKGKPQNGKEANMIVYDFIEKKKDTMGGSSTVGGGGTAGSDAQGGSAITRPPNGEGGSSSIGSSSSGSGSGSSGDESTRKERQTESSPPGGHAKRRSKGDKKEVNQNGHAEKGQTEKDQMEKEEPHRSEPLREGSKVGPN